MDGESGTGISGVGPDRVLGSLTGAALHARIADYLPGERGPAAARLLADLVSDDGDPGAEAMLVAFIGQHTEVLATDGY